MSIFVESMLMNEKHLHPRWWSLRPKELGNLWVQILNAQILITLQRRVVDLEGLEAVDEETLPFSLPWCGGLTEWSDNFQSPKITFRPGKLIRIGLEIRLLKVYFDLPRMCFNDVLARSPSARLNNTTWTGTLLSCFLIVSEHPPSQRDIFGSK